MSTSQSLVVVAALISGCGDSGRSAPAIVPLGKGGGLIDDPAMSHDFGAVVARPGPPLRHVFRLTNRTGGDVAITNWINARPCCGEVEARAGRLKPGESTEVAVAVRVAGQFGDVSHEVVVETDRPGSPPLRLRSVARAYPPLRIEESDPTEGHEIAVGRAEPRRLSFRAIAYGTDAEPPIDLDRAALESGAEVRWAGPKRVEPHERGLRVESRSFTAAIAAGDHPEVRAESIALRSDGVVAGSQSLRWEIVAPIGVVPQLIARTPGMGEFRLRLQARDRRPFRVVGVEFDGPGVRVEEGDRSASVGHSIRIAFGAGLDPARPRLVMRVATDHPDQPRLEIPILILN